MKIFCFSYDRVIYWKKIKIYKSFTRSKGGIV